MINDIVINLKRGNFIHDPIKKLNGKIVSKKKLWDSIGDSEDFYLGDGIYGGVFSYYEYGVIWNDNCNKVITYDEDGMEKLLKVSRGKIIQDESNL